MRFVIFALLAKLCMVFIIFDVFPNLPIVWICKIAKTLSHTMKHLLKGFSGLEVVDSAFSTLFISFCYCIITVVGSQTHWIARAASLPTRSLIHFSFTWWFKKCVSCHYSATCCSSDRTVHNAPNAWSFSGLKPLCPVFTWWRHCVDYFINLTYCTGGSGETFTFRAFTIVSFVYHVVVECNVGCCKIWTTCCQAVSIMSWWVDLNSYNKQKSVI